MAKFLNTSATNYFLEELIKTASERLTLISPFLKLNDRVKELLEDKDRLKIDVRMVYGKNELQPEEINWLRELSFVRTSFCKNLHAKCYLNESTCIVTSLNLYEFSQVNNNEMGVLLSRDSDPELYRDAYEEAQRIIRISDEVRMSLEKVDSSKPPLEKASSQSAAADGEDMLSSSRVAKHLGLSTKDFLLRLAETGYLKEVDSEFALTDKSTGIGAEKRVSKRFGEYFVWPTARIVAELSE